MNIPEAKKMKVKICLVGEWAVGKTSLIRRFVFDDFRDSYIRTIGTKVTKKEMTLEDPEEGGELNLSMMIWDIMGQKGFRQLLQEAYFYGAQGLIAVCDLTNKDSLAELEGWVDTAFDVTGKIPVVFIANKNDLTDQFQFSLEDLKEFANKYERSQALTSSAKTGENVGEAFDRLSKEILTSGEE